MSEGTIARPVAARRRLGAVATGFDRYASGTGTYSQFRTFLSAMEWSLRPLDLVDLSIAPGDAVH